MGLLFYRKDMFIAYCYVKANDMLGGMYNLSWDVNVYNQSIVIQMLFVVGLFAAYLVI